MILYSLISKAEEHNMDRVRELEKMRKIRGVERIKEVKRVEKAIAEIR